MCDEAKTCNTDYRRSVHGIIWHCWQLLCIHVLMLLRAFGGHLGQGKWRQWPHKSILGWLAACSCIDNSQREWTMKRKTNTLHSYRRLTWCKKNDDTTNSVRCKKRSEWKRGKRRTRKNEGERSTKINYTYILRQTILKCVGEIVLFFILYITVIYQLYCF